MALAAAMTLVPMNVFAAANDISGHWAERTISEWQSKNLIGGYEDGSFKPDKPVTRAEFVRIMNNALGFSQYGQFYFSDVSVSDWFYNDVAIAVGQSYTSGFPDATFRPNETVTRAQAAVFIANAINISGGSVSVFTDSDQIPDWARSSVGAMIANGYMSGYTDGTFRPNAVLTRAEAVSTLDRAMDNSQGSVGSNEDVVVDQDDTRIEDRTIEGNLVISENVGDGEVYLDNVEIEGNLIVQGGGNDSIYLNDTKVNGRVIMDKKNVRLQVSGETKLPDIIVNQACSLDEKDFDGEIGTITIDSEISEKININVAAEELVVTEKADLSVNKNIDEITIDSDASSTKLKIASGVKVGTVIADGKVAITGSGTISKLEANASGITYSSSLTIKDTDTASGVKAPTKSSSSSGGSSGGSSSSSTKTVDSISEFKSALNKSSVKVIKFSSDADLSGTINIDTDRTKDIEIRFGTKNVGDLTIEAKKLDGDIVLKDDGTGSAGATIASLTIDAPKAHVENNVKVTGTTTIKAVEDSTFAVNDAAGPINIEGPARLEVKSGVSTGKISIKTSDEVILDGDIDEVLIEENDAEVTVEGDVANLAVAASDVILNTKQGATISTLTTSESVELEGKGTIEGIDIVVPADASANSIVITVDDNVDVDAINVIGDTSAVKVVGSDVEVKEKVADPVVALSKIAADNREEDVTFTVTPVGGVTFYYTTDGSTPTDASEGYSDTVTLTAPDVDTEATVNVKVIGIKEGFTNSNVVTKTVTYAAKADIIAPEIATVSDAEVAVTDAATWEAPTTTASDNVDGDITGSIVVTYSSDDAESTVTDLASARTHLGTEGKTVKVTYTVSDAAGNAADPVVATFTAVEEPAELKEITGFTLLEAVALATDEHITDLAALKASGKLPTTVEVTDGTTPANATITDWTGEFDGTVIGEKTLTAVWTMPVGYEDEADPIEVTITVNVNEAQTEVPDETAPILSGINVTRTNETTGTAKFTSNETGTYEVIVVAKDGEAPIAFAGEGTALTADTEVTADAKDVYILVKDAAGNLTVSEKQALVAYTAPDETAPILSGINVTRTNETTGTAKFTSNETGTYEVIVVAKDGEAPIAFAGEGTALTADTEVTAAFELTADAKDVYILVKDAAGNLTVSEKQALAAYTAPDETTPILSGINVTRTNETTGTAKFTSNETGTYEVIVVAKDGEAPIAFAGEGTALTADTEVTAAFELTADAKDVYILVKDAAGNLTISEKQALAAN